MEFKYIPSNWRIVLPSNIQKNLLNRLIKIEGKCGVAAKSLGISWGSFNRYRRCEVFLTKKVFMSLCEKLNLDPKEVYAKYSNQSVSFLYKKNIDKEKRLKEILAYVEKCLKKRYFPSGNELHKKFRIYRMGFTLKKIYSYLGVNFLLLPKKPSNSREEIKELLINYLREEVSRNHFPSRKEIEQKFHLRLDGLFKGIDDLYRSAGLQYKQVENQAIKIEKARKLLKIAINVLERMKLKVLIVREPNQQGIDIIVGEPNRCIGVELKAYNKFEKVKKKDILQLKKFKAREKLIKLLLFTTTNRISTKIPPWVEVFTFKRLKNYCSEEEIKVLNEIREKSIHIETKDKEEKRQRILDYVKKNAAKGKYVGADDILHELGTYVYTYFKNMDEVYGKAGIKVSLRRSRYIRNPKLKEKVRKELLNEILQFIRDMVAKGHYPSGTEIGEAFGVKNIWNYWRVGDLYRMLNLPTYLERRRIK
jgi:hypothetical protein